MDSSRLHFTAVIPFFNEERFLPRTLESLIAQERLPDCIIMIDNASSDGSARIAKAFAVQHARKLEILCLAEDQPGKIHALERAGRHFHGDWVAYCDADTWYPPHYLRRAEQLIRRSPSDIVAVMAVDLLHPPPRHTSLLRIQAILLLSRLFPRKCHAGGYGHIFKVSALRQAGGYSSVIWSHVLMDHEIVNRLHRFGRSLYHPDMWCMPADRRGNRDSLRWNRWERLIYFLHPFALGDWFFYSFLHGRFERRRLRHLNLRQQPWNKTPSDMRTPD